ncbi:MAG: hypothetical protein U9N73_03380 [Candidatus Auribacterota bacterium]|nr:hypothetical protein [Candidatus Auribacterota bacterium]
MTQATLRIVVGIVGGLVIITRIYGVINPAKTKHLSARIARLGPGWIRALYVILGLLGAWILYSALVIIFSQVPVFLVISFLIGLLLLLSGMFIIHPEWFPEVLKGLLVDRGDLFVRFLCLIGLLVGAFFLLSAIFGGNWGG